MEVEISRSLKDDISFAKTGLQIQARLFPENEILERYMNRPYGNAYDFDQVDRVTGFF
jgi:hypothetical protein